MTLINNDFRVSDKPERHPALRWAIFAAGCIMLGAVIAGTTSLYQNRELPDSAELSRTVLATTAVPAYGRIARQSFNLPLPELQAQQGIMDEINHVALQQWREFTVKSGDNLAALFKRAAIKPQQLDEMMKSGAAATRLKKIFPNDIVRILINEAGELQALRYEINHESYVRVERDTQGMLRSELLSYELETRQRHAQGVIDSSLFQAANDAGISDNIIMQLAGIFGWDIDFVLDIRKGDSFTVLYEEIFRNGEKIADGNILAAEFINDKQTYQAVRYQKPGSSYAEYYTPDGASMRKAFLRSPVNFTRISSTFSLGRYHPILHKIREHKGVDYAAKRGTPVLAAGDGKIVYQGQKGGYGRVVIIQHGSQYSTLYAHLNSYNKHLGNGKKVRQGETIGYVGSSGLATGPHLHYEFRLNGAHRNPLTVKLPSAQPVEHDLLADFKQRTQPVLAQLELRTRTQLALNN